MRRLWLVVLLGGCVAGFIGVELMLENGFSAKDHPTFVDAFIARWWRRLAVPREERAARNPLPATPDVVARGREHFAADCTACHGSDGRGGTRISEGLYPRPPDLTSAATQSLSDGEIFWVIQNGVRLSAMPGWGGDTEESDQWTWELVRFVRDLPRLTTKDVEAVEAMRPRLPKTIEEEIAARRFLGEPATPPRPVEDAHHETTIMGSVVAVSSLRLQVLTSAGATISFLVDHPGPTRFVRGRRQVQATDVRAGAHVVVKAVRDQDWWLAREVRLPLAGGPS